MQLEDIPNLPIYSHTVVEMLAVAFDYCSFMEKADTRSVKEISSYLVKVLPLLYVKGELLPEVEPEYPEANERYVTEEEWEGLFNILRIKFERNDIYYTFDPAAYGWGEALKVSLSEHLSDIYQDMKDFVILYQKNSRAAKENAVAEVKRLFTSHWGPRVVSTLTALHYLAHDEPGPYFTDSNILEADSI